MADKYPAQAWVALLAESRAYEISHYLGQNQSGVAYFGRLLLAKIFNSKKEAKKFRHEKCPHQLCNYRMLTKGDKRKFYLYHIRRVAREVLGLKMNTPWYILADAFYDAGMYEEERCLKREFNLPRDKPSTTKDKQAKQAKSD